MCPHPAIYLALCVFSHTVVYLALCVFSHTVVYLALYMCYILGYRTAAHELFDVEVCLFEVGH